MSIGKHEKPNKGETDTWLTPPWLLKRLGHFDLDPCPPNGTEGLVINWYGRVWLNPPYSKNTEFMKKMALHGSGIALVFARTETKWFQEWVFPYAHSILFFNKRLKFYKEDGTEAKGTAGAPSVLIAYSREDHEVLQGLNDLGVVLVVKGQLPYFIFKNGTLVMLAHVMVVRETYNENIFAVVFTGAWTLEFPKEEMGSFTQALMDYKES